MIELTTKKYQQLPEIMKRKEDQEKKEKQREDHEKRKEKVRELQEVRRKIILFFIDFLFIFFLKKIRNKSKK